MHYSVRVPASKSSPILNSELSIECCHLSVPNPNSYAQLEYCMQIASLSQMDELCSAKRFFPLFASDSSDTDEVSAEELTTVCRDVVSSPLGDLILVGALHCDEITQILFRDRYRMKRPVVLRNMCGEWAATSTWGIAGTISSRMSSSSGTTLISKDNLNFLFHELCFVSDIPANDAIDDILGPSISSSKMYTRIYLDHHPQLLSHIDSSILSHIAGDVVFVDRNIGVWVSSEGCVTPLHYDLCHGFLCQLVGRKQFLLAAPSDTHFMYRNDSIVTKNQTSSQIDLYKWMNGDESERKKHPHVGEAQWFCADLQPGDVLYTPPGWWHYVTSIDRSISALLPFDMCGDEHMSILQSL